MARVVWPSWALVKRELMTYLRGYRAFLLVLLFVGVGGLGTIAIWPKRLYPGSSQAEELLVFMASLFLGGGLLIIPGLAAVSITTEKERETFDLLHMTLIYPSGILVAKLLNVLGFYYLLLIAAMPILGAIFFLTGVDWQQVLSVFALISATVFACAMAGILWSAVFRRSIVAIILSYLSMVWLTGGPLVVLMVAILELLNNYRIVTSDYMAEFTARLCSPLFSMMSVLGKSPLAGNVYMPLGYQLGCGILCFFLARAVLLRPPRPPRVDTRAPIDAPELLEKRRKQFPFYLIDPLRRKKSIEDHRNPMLVKELRWGVLGRPARLIRMFYSAFILYMLFTFWIVVIGLYSRGPEWPVVYFLMAQILLTVTVAPALLANSLTKEYELGNMDFLRTTLLAPRHVLLGKAFAGFVILTPLLLAALANGFIVCVFLVLRESFDVLELLATGYGTLLACTVYSVGLILFASSITKRTSASIVLSYLLSILAYGGLCVLVALLLELWYWLYLLGRPASSEYVESFVMFLSPIVAFIYNIGEPRWSPERTLNSYWLGNTVTYFLFGWLLIGLSVAIFRRFRMQDR